MVKRFYELDEKGNVLGSYACNQLQWENIKFLELEEPSGNQSLYKRKGKKWVLKDE